MRTLARLVGGVVFVSALWGGGSTGQTARGEEVASAAFLVQQALEAEAHGDLAGRNEKLDAALEKDPNFPAANWLVGKIKADGKWVLAANSLGRARDELEKAYDDRRAKCANVKDRFQLAIWCREQGWEDRSLLYYAEVLGDPTATAEMRRESVKQLDLVRVGERWAPREEQEREERELRERSKNTEYWLPKLRQWETSLEGTNRARQQFAQQSMTAIKDLAFLPACDFFLLSESETFVLELIKVLARLDTPETSVALTRFAVLSPLLAVREKATAALAGRPLHEFVPLLLHALEGDLQMTFGVLVDSRGNIRIRRVMEYEAHEGKVVSINDRQESMIAQKVGAPTHEVVAPRPLQPYERINGTRTTYTPMPGADPTSVAEARARAQDRAQLHVAQGKADQAAVETRNAFVKLYNDRFTKVLGKVTNQPFGANAKQWWDWWQQYNDVYARQRQPRYQYSWSRGCYYVYLQQPVGRYTTNYVVQDTRPRISMSCFPAGMKVWTESGLEAIETIQAGDRVLSQNPETGELQYRVVLTTTQRADAELMTAKTADEALVTSPGHPFWVNKRGWQMTKELKAGDVLHTLDGCTELVETSALPGKATVYNLVVADWNTYFVGLSGVLVHDVTYRQPTRAIVPGLVAK